MSGYRLAKCPHCGEELAVATTDEPGLRTLRDRVSAEFVAGGPPLALAGRVLAHIDRLLALTPTPDDRDREVERIGQIIDGLTWLDPQAMYDAGLRASGGTE